MAKKTYKEIVREEELFKDTDRELEGLTPIKARVGKEARAVFAVRLSQAELEQLQTLPVEKAELSATLCGPRHSLPLKAR